MRLSFSLRVCAYMRARVCVVRIKIHLIGPELVCYSHWGEKVTRGRLVARSANKRIGSAATSCFIIHRCKDWEWKTNREFLLIVARSSVKRRRDRYEASKKIIFLSTLSISTRDSSFTISYNLAFSYYTLVKIGGKQDLSVRQRISFPRLLFQLLVTYSVWRKGRVATVFIGHRARVEQTGVLGTMVHASAGKGEPFECKGHISKGSETGNWRGWSHGKPSPSQ